MCRNKHRVGKQAKKKTILRTLNKATDKLFHNQKLPKVTFMGELEKVLRLGR